MNRLIAMCMLAFCAATFAAPAHANLKVFACEPEWGALLAELGGDKLDVDVGTSALQDVHVIEAKPSLIAKVRRADLIADIAPSRDDQRLGDGPGRDQQLLRFLDRGHAGFGLRFAQHDRHEG